MVLRAIGSAGVTGRILDSEELAELLYVAYNRDDANLLPLVKEYKLNMIHCTQPEKMC